MIEEGSPTLVERFWKKVSVGNATDCWLWTGMTDKEKYGRIKLNGKKSGTVKAHRLSWEIHNGGISAGKIICHTCDNPICVNPSHLYAGTWTDNAQDRTARNRNNSNLGVARYNSKLTPESIEKILEMYKQGNPQASIGKYFGVSQSLISVVVAKKQWKSFDRESVIKSKKETAQRGESQHSSVLKEADILEIRKIRKEQKVSQQKLADMFGVSQSLISEILLVKIWTHI